MTPTQTKAQSLGICLWRKVKYQIDADVSARSLHDKLGDILRRHPEAQGEVSFNRDYDDYVDEITFNFAVDKTDAELEAEINRHHTEYTRAKDQRYAEYLKLREEFGGGNSQ